MASITQLASALNLEGVQGNPFAVQATISLFDQNNNPLPFTDLSAPVATVYQDGLAVASDAPTITVGSDYYQLTWSSAQTFDIAARSGLTWSLQVSIASNQVALLAGTITMAPPSTPGASNSTTAALTVNVGQDTANITVQLGSYSGGGGGGGSITLVQNTDGTVTIAGGSGPTVTVSRAAITGDVSVPAGSDTATLASVGTAGTTGDASHVAQVTTDAKGRVTGTSAVGIVIAESAVTNLTTDLAAKAPLASPALTGTPTAPTAAALTDSTQVATTAYTDSAVAVETGRAETAEGLAAQKSANLSDLANEATARANLGLGSAATHASTDFDAAGTSAAETTRAEAAEALLAPLASPALTGTPTAPTKAALTDNTDIATTAYADSAVSVEKTRAQAAEALLAPLASPALTGTPTAPTKPALTDNTDIATTAYADAAVGVETSRAEGAEALLAPLASPHLTGLPLAPTAAHGTDNTQIATTAFVLAELPVYNALDYGIVANGSTDDTSAWNALFVTVATAGGGTIYLPGGYTSLCSGVLTPMPFGSSAPALRITGAGGYRPYGDPAAGASVLDLRFNGNAGTNLGKIDCRGYGRLELDHLTLKSGGTDDFLFFYATNSTAYLHDLQFSGHSANSGSSCVQDAIQLGASPGNLSDIGTGAADAPFQGYGTVIERNGFNRIRSAVRLCAAANGVVVRDNTIDNLCGGDTTHGAFTLPSGTVSAPTSNIFSGNLIEVTHYPFAWVFAGGNQNQCVGNALFDGTTGTNKTVTDAGTGNRFYATAIDGSFTDYPDVGSSQIITSGTSFTPTASGTYLVVCIGPGGSGGGGGTPSSALNLQVGGSGGAQGGCTQALMSLVSGTAYTVAIGPATAPTATTAAGGHAGANGTSSSVTTFAGPALTLSANPGAPGVGGGASSTTAVGGATSTLTATLTAGATPLTNSSGGTSADGWGGAANSVFGALPACSGGAPIGLGAGGGGGGGCASTTNGGGGGNAGAFGQAPGGGLHTSGSANGVNGASAASTSYGGGGGGGGAGATATGTGGAGGAGGPGVIYVIGPFPQW